MKRHATLLLCLGVAACTAPRDAEDSGEIGAEETAEVAQAVESLVTPSEPNAIRFLEQATFGPRLANGVSPLPIDSVEKVVSAGITQSITSQFNAASVAFDGSSAAQSLEAQFFVQAIDGTDQLRQRVAFALSQILVVSMNGLPVGRAGDCEPENPRPEHCLPKQAMAAYMNILRENAFGNYKTILTKVTKSVAMGQYLDMLNNRAFDKNGNAVIPNENYARELLQLFSLGLNQLKDDGTLKLVGGKPVPAYTEEHVQAFAQALSGWTYAKLGGTGNVADDCPTVGKNNPLNYLSEMIPCAVNHDSTSQTLLCVDDDSDPSTPKVCQTTTQGGSPLQHLNQAINNIFLHDNLPPFISKQLIQHLVTSNPSPAYVGRVVAKFKDNGNKVRGDMKAVIRAILEDTEARGAAPAAAQSATFGHLRSPVLQVTNVVRWLDGHLDLSNGKNPGQTLYNVAAGMGQAVTRPPSVFSFYPPSAPLPGDGSLLAPEFGLHNAAGALNRANATYNLLFAAAYTNAGVILNFGALPSDPDDLVTWLGRYPLHSSMSSDLLLTIHGAIGEPWANTTLKKQRLGMMLTTLSPEFAIQR